MMFQESPILSLPMNGGDSLPIYASDIVKWKKLYLDVDVWRELDSIRVWLEGAPDKRRKSEAGTLRLISTWLYRTQQKIREVEEIEKNKDLKWTRFSEECPKDGGLYIILTKYGYCAYEAESDYIWSREVANHNLSAWIKIPEFKQDS